MLDPWINAIRWNVSPRRRARFASADAIVVTLPKSGTTWLRVFLYSYFCGLERRPFTLKDHGLAGAGVPRLMFTHDLFDHGAEPRLLTRLRGRYLIPPRERRTKPILLMVRDPRDVIVSLYFELRRNGARPSYAGTLAAMIEHPAFGIERLVDVLNCWIRDWAGQPQFTLIRYEACRREPETTFREVLRFLGFREVVEAVFQKSVEFAGFENMKRLEEVKQFDYRGLARADPGDPESFRVRRGIVGGYREYLTSEQVDILDRALARLDPSYGYR